MNANQRAALGYLACGIVLVTIGLIVLAHTQNDLRQRNNVDYDQAVLDEANLALLHYMHLRRERPLAYAEEQRRLEWADKKAEILLRNRWNIYGPRPRASVLAAFNEQPR